MSDFIAPLILIVLTIIMAIGVKKLQTIVDEQNLAESNAMRKGRPNSLATTVIDNFLRDDDSLLLQKLQSVHEWKTCNDADPRFWDGQSEPNNIWEELASKIWTSRPEFKDAVGFEYWCNIVKSGQELPWHIDKDETAMKESFALITPLHGAVYYGFDHDDKFTGGKLWTVDAQYGDEPMEYEDFRRNEIIEYTANFDRLIYFNASLWHRVSDVKSGKRYAFAVNALKTIPRKFRT